jgi:type IV secretory pathway VirB3-like protein
MSFRAAQDHKAAGRDTTLSTPSSTRREDTATTNLAVVVLCSLAVVLVFVLVSCVTNYIVVELVLLIVNYIYCGFDDMCMMLLLCEILLL